MVKITVFFSACALAAVCAAGAAQYVPKGYSRVWEDSVDGDVVNTLKRSASKKPSEWPDEDMYIILNNGVRTKSPNKNTTWPNRLVVDYIEVYQK